MKRFGFGFGVAAATTFVAFGWTAGCHDSAEATASAVCSIVCPCEKPGATSDQLVQCISSCESQATAISADCSDCIIQNGDSCGTLMAVCDAACGTIDMNPGPGSGSGPSANVVSGCQLDCTCGFPMGPASSITSCETDCESQISEACATCLNADGTCQATTTCANQCQ
jgi:hypothetical protein